MARKPKYSKEDFVIEAVNKMLEKHNTTYEQVSEYPVFYNGVWYPGKEIFELNENGVLVPKKDNIIETQIQKNREELTLEYNKLKEGLEGEQLEELTKKFNNEILKLIMWHWYEYYTWTTEEELEFKKWFVDECRSRFRMTKKHSEQEASWWLLGYGLRTVDNK